LVSFETIAVASPSAFLLPEFHIVKLVTHRVNPIPIHYDPRPRANHVAATNLVLIGAVGRGASSRRQAVELALKETVPNAHIANVDILTLPTPRSAKSMAKQYLELVNNRRTPWIFYDWNGTRPRVTRHNVGDKCRRAW